MTESISGKKIKMLTVLFQGSEPPKPKSDT